MNLKPRPKPMVEVIWEIAYADRFGPYKSARHAWPVKHADCEALTRKLKVLFLKQEAESYKRKIAHIENLLKKYNANPHTNHI